MDPQQPPDGLVRTKEGFYVLRDDTHLSRWVEEHGRLDVAEAQIAFYKEFIPVGGIVVDAGASLGDHTLTYAKLVGPTGLVLAIEPNPLSIQALKLNFKRWGNVLPFEWALGEGFGEAYFVREPNAGASHVGRGNNITVSCAPLDWFMASAERLDFIHFDLEGYEVRALRGAAESIAKFKPAIVLEINHECLSRNGESEATVIGLMDEMGYGWRELEPHLDSSYPQRDILFLPK